MEVVWGGHGTKRCRGARQEVNPAEGYGNAGRHAPEQEHFWNGGSASKPPRFSAFAPGFPDGGASGARPSESRPLSRRSGCVSAEPYPPLRSVQSTRDDELRKTGGRLPKTLDAPSIHRPEPKHRIQTERRPSLVLRPSGSLPLESNSAFRLILRLENAEGGV